MSYAIAAPLQTAVYGALAADPALSAIVGQHVYDALPAGRLPAISSKRVRNASFSAPR